MGSGHPPDVARREAAPIALLTDPAHLRAGLSALTKTMSNEFARDGVLVNAVLPGHVLTATAEGVERDPLARSRGSRSRPTPPACVATIPIGPAARPDEIGDVVAFLASERASYVTAPPSRWTAAPSRAPFETVERDKVTSEAIDGLGLRVVTPTRSVDRDGGRTVELPRRARLPGILPGHAPLISLLKTGVLTYRRRRRRSRSRSPTGFVEVAKTRSPCLADLAEEPADAMSAAAERDRSQAEEELKDRLPRDARRDPRASGASASPYGRRPGEIVAAFSRGRGLG